MPFRPTECADYNGRMELNISLAQIDIRFGELAANVETVTRMTEEAK